MNPEHPDPPEATPRTGVVGHGGDFARDHLTLLLIAGVVAVGIAITYLTRAQGERVPVAVVTPSLLSATPLAGSASATTRMAASQGSPGAEASGAGGGTIVVQVLGPVRRPGVITVPAGTRVGEAIARCGGLTASAAPSELNLAAILHDADQVIIGTRDVPGGVVRNGSQAASNSTVAAGAAPTVVDLNVATLDELDAIPGIGPVTAQKILEWRTQHQRFTAVSELREIDGIGPKTYARIAPYVRA